MLSIIQAEEIHLQDIVPLFDAYRIFYEQKSNPQAALFFLKNRLSKKESIIFVAYHHKIPVGFTQLYFSFSSVSLQPSLVLNDLYVKNEFRQKKIGEALLKKAKSYCLENGYKGLALETATDNPAQSLYEKLGWKKDSHCFHYFWATE